MNYFKLTTNAFVYIDSLWHNELVLVFVYGFNVYENTYLAMYPDPNLIPEQPRKRGGILRSSWPLTVVC